VSITQDIEAVYTHRVLKPAADLNLQEQQRVRVIVEPFEDDLGDREAAVARLKPTLRACSSFRTGACPLERTSMIALDTNVLLYTCDRADSRRQQRGQLAPGCGRGLFFWAAQQQRCA